jgi:glyoxylase-like metal-dependent hydrolase (beta-lactamase superfamily II)
MQLYSINTGFFKLDGGAMFGVVPKTMWNKLNPADENNMCNWAMRCLLIQHESRLILVDNGIGDKQDAKFFSHYFLNGNDTLEKSLASHGFHSSDITDVLLTHLHFDHCGGSIKKEGDTLVPAFSNATYWSDSRHWEWATNPNDREKASFLKENILPIAESGQLKFTDLHASDFPADINLRHAFGHTEAMILPEVEYKGKKLVFMADLIPAAAHIPVPYVMAYDMFPMKTLVEKKAFLEEACDKEMILFFEHDPVNECCTLQRTEKGIRVKDIFKLSEI